MAQPVCSLSGRVAIEIGLRILELGLIAISVGGELFDLRLVRTRVDLREQVASVHVLSFLEVDADDLSLDLGAHDVRVEGDDGADTGQIDRYVVLGDHSGDDWRRRDAGVAAEFSAADSFDVNPRLYAKAPPARAPVGL